MVRSIAIGLWLIGTAVGLAQSPAAVTDAITSAAPVSDPHTATGLPETPADQPAEPNAPQHNSTQQADSGPLSVQQQDGLRAAILAQSSAAVSNTDLDATIGAAVPDGIALHDVPAGTDSGPLSGLQYVVLTDGRIVLVVPGTRQIRAILG